MPDSTSDARLEIAHVLFMDIVGWSKLLINEQSELLRKLNEIVRNSAQVRAAEAAGKLIRLPTGDGMALAFFTTPDAPVRCAVEIGKELKKHPNLLLRMGIHSGPVDEVVDVNERANIAGAGITIAQRVMDCGNAGHILLSKRAADDLAHYAQWRPHLHELGDCEVKHGLKLGLVNFYTDEVGNPELPDRFPARGETSARTDQTELASRRRMLLTGLAALLIVLLAAVFWFLSHRTQQSAGNTTTATIPPVGKRLAVLPFKPLVPESADQVLELGMADTLITKLSNSREMIVSSLTAVRKFGGLEQDAVAAGRALQVNSVLDGNVQKVGDRIRVSARLIKVADGSSLWAATFDEKFTNVFAVQDAISQKVADALALQLTGDENKRLNKRYTGNIQAYQLYLEGRYHWNKLTPLELSKSIEFFKKAIDLDPTYALAYFGLADAYRALAPTSEVRPTDILPQAKAAAMKALELDESLAEPHGTLALIHVWFDWDWAGAEKEARRAIERNPNWAFGHIAYSQFLSSLGRHQEAANEAAKAAELDPLSPIVNTLNGVALYFGRRNDEAFVELQKTLQLEPNFWIAHLFLGKTYLTQRKYPEAIAELTRAEELSGGNTEPISERACAWVMAGEIEKARVALTELRSLSTQRYVPATNVAVLCYALGEKDEAFVWLEKAYQEHDIRLCRASDQRWDLLRTDSRFAPLLKRIGLK